MKSLKTALLLLLAVIISATLVFAGCTTKETATTEHETPLASTTLATTTAPTNTPEVTPELLQTTVETVPETPSRTMSPEEDFLSKGMDNFQNLNSYQYDLKYDISLNVTGDQVGSLVMKVTSNGGTDKSAKAMIMKMSSAMTLVTQQSPDTMADNYTTNTQNMSYDVYELGDWAYIRTKTTEEVEQWAKYSIANPDKAFNVDALKQQTVMLDSPSEIKIVGEEILNGFDCYILSVTPDMGSLAKYLNKQQAGNTDFAKILDYKDVLKQYSILCWVGKSSDLLMRMSVSILMEYSAKEAGLSSSVKANTIATLTIDMTMSDFDKPFTVTLPPEADSAKNKGSLTL